MKLDDQQQIFPILCSLPIGSTRPPLGQNAVSVLPIIARRSLAHSQSDEHTAYRAALRPPTLVWFLA
jgi:hypothetical protein